MDSALVENYRFLARYNHWFNQRLYDACEQLTDEERKRDRGAFFGSIHHSLTHLVMADRMWLHRFARQEQAFASLDADALALPPGTDYTSDLHPDWQDLKGNRERVDAVIEAWLAEMQPEFLVSAMRYANTKGVLRNHPAWMALTHFFNHQTHHRGQTTTLLTQVGIDVGVTDLISRV